MAQTLFADLSTFSFDHCFPVVAILSRAIQVIPLFTPCGDVWTVVESVKAISTLRFSFVARSLIPGTPFQTRFASSVPFAQIIIFNFLISSIRSFVSTYFVIFAVSAD